MEQGRSIFHIGERGGIWRVQLDGRFFGDYRSQRQARESVEEAAALLRVSGSSVQVLSMPEDTSKTKRRWH